MRRSPVLAVVLGLSLLTGNVVDAATITWRIGTVNGDASLILGRKIDREHYRVCGEHLDYDKRIAWAAKWKAIDMAFHDRLAHGEVGTDKRAWDFYDEAGITWSLAAEILAQNNYPDDQSPGHAFTQFMDSREHRRAIRHCGYTRFGVGSFKTSNGQRWFAVEFVQS